MVRQVIYKTFNRIALALMALAAVTAATLAGDLNPSTKGGKKKTEVKVTAKADKPGQDGKQTVVITMEINPTWYAYANPVGNEDFASNATVIKVSAKEKVDNVKIAYPPGKTKKDSVVGNYNIYEGKIDVPLTIQRAKGDTSPLVVSVQYMTCNVKGVCLPVETVKLTVP